MELRMSPENIQAALPVIGFNYDELKAELAERLQHYNGLVVTEDTIKDAKTDRANLNKLRTAIDTRRKEVKKAYMVPFNNFEAQCKELTALIDEPIKVIDYQLNEFDERRKQEKLKQVIDEYEILIPDAQKDIIPFDRIFDKRWLNSTMSILKVQDALRDWSKRVGADLIAMDAVDQEYKAAVRRTGGLRAQTGRTGRPGREKGTGSRNETPGGRKKSSGSHNSTGAATTAGSTASQQTHPGICDHQGSGNRPERVPGPERYQVQEVHRIRRKHHGS